ncbi:hypothetical protein ASZ90_000985 [hydrocarbon metagenome]|uniref:Uncharacterized protein n=1 Tax=hydrocarbon metagenome TaxID=938273 RepID=A0A0W8G9H5_9ZZZZ
MKSLGENVRRFAPSGKKRARLSRRWPGRRLVPRDAKITDVSLKK